MAPFCRECSPIGDALRDLHLPETALDLRIIGEEKHVVLYGQASTSTTSRTRMSGSPSTHTQSPGVCHRAESVTRKETS